LHSIYSPTGVLSTGFNYQSVYENVILEKGGKRSPPFSKLVSHLGSFLLSINKIVSS
jgi:hypothetical protein